VRLVAVFAVVFTVVDSALGALALAWVRQALGHDPERLRTAQIAIVASIGALLACSLGALLVSLIFVRRYIIVPAEQLMHVAEGITAGDLAIPLRDFGTDHSIGRLGRAMGAMRATMRELVGATRASGSETASLAAEIAASADSMSAAAGEIAHTSSVLSGQSAEMAHTLGEAAGDAGRLRHEAERVAAGVRDEVARNAELRRLARENRVRLDASTQGLTALAGEAESSAAAVEALAEASEQIRAFVTLVRKIARQSKLLALNASMEAARAGEHGEGFAVVASEIRKLATTSNASAERTETVVSEVLERVRESRDRSRRTAQTVLTVRQAAEAAIASFAQVEELVEATEAWAASVERASGESSRLVNALTQRLDALSHGTETFAAAMQQVAAASEQQSAGTEEIAAAAAALAAASHRLAELVAHYRLEERQTTTEGVAVPSARQAPDVVSPPARALATA
jgi:methyl-accepting chemotaxis protein